MASSCAYVPGTFVHQPTRLMTILLRIFTFFRNHVDSRNAYFSLFEPSCQGRRRGNYFTIVYDDLPPRVTMRF